MVDGCCCFIHVILEQRAAAGKLVVTRRKAEPCTCICLADPWPLLGGCAGKAQ